MLGWTSEQKARKDVEENGCYIFKFLPHFSEDTDKKKFGKFHLTLRYSLFWEIIVLSSFLIFSWSDSPTTSHAVEVYKSHIPGRIVWKSAKLFAPTQHTSNTQDGHAWPQRDSNPLSQESSAIDASTNRIEFIIYISIIAGFAVHHHRRLAWSGSLYIFAELWLPCSTPEHWCHMQGEHKYTWHTAEHTSVPLCNKHLNWPCLVQTDTSFPVECIKQTRPDNSI